MKRSFATAFAVALACAGAAIIVPLAAQEPEAAKTLIPGKGSDLTQAKCAICHDITHVTRTRLSRDEWEENYKVMITRGMPSEPQEAAIIIEYLATYYNRDKPPPAPAVAEKGAPAAPAAAPQQLIAERGCVACHALDKRVIGPSFREIAGRHKADNGAVATLATRVREGSTGIWGPIPMPAHPQIAEEEARRLSAWILQQHP